MFHYRSYALTALPLAALKYLTGYFRIVSGVRLRPHPTPAKKHPRSALI